MRRAGIPFCFALVVLVGCDDPIVDPPVPGPQPITDAQLRQTLNNWGVIPIGPMPAQDPAMVALGRALFFDKELSGNRDVACATCHEPAASLTAGRSLPVGTGAVGTGPDRQPRADRGFVPRRSPSLLNVGLGMPYMFWDGRLTGFGQGPFFHNPDTSVFSGVPSLLAAQALLPVLNRAEMRGEPGDRDVFGRVNELAAFDDDQRTEIWQAVMGRLRAIPEYVQLFNAAFPDTPTNLLRFQDAAEAIAAFEREAFTKTDSPFDRFLDRDDNALSGEARRGALLFFGEAQCVTCHNGPFLGGQDFANVGAPQVGPGMGSVAPLDLGRGELQNFEFYRFAFRVAPLRNVELTGPYMHSGAYPTLEAVIDHYDDVLEAMREYDVTQLAPELRDSHHGDEQTIALVMETLDFRVSLRQEFTDDEKAQLVAFLRSLTDPAARDLSSVMPDRVPSGLPIQ